MLQHIDEVYSTHLRQYFDSSEFEKIKTHINLSIIKEFVASTKHKIVSYFINYANLCYAVLIENATRKDEIKPKVGGEKLLNLAPETKDKFLKVKFKLKVFCGFFNLRFRFFVNNRQGHWLGFWFLTK